MRAGQEGLCVLCAQVCKPAYCEGIDFDSKRQGPSVVKVQMDGKEL